MICLVQTVVQKTNHLKKELDLTIGRSHRQQKLPRKGYQIDIYQYVNPPGLAKIYIWIMLNGNNKKAQLKRAKKKEYLLLISTKCKFQDRDVTTIRTMTSDALSTPIYLNFMSNRKKINIQNFPLKAILIQKNNICPSNRKKREKLIRFL